MGGVLSRVDSSVPTRVSIEVDPQRVARAFRAVLRSSVIADSKPVVNGSVEFSVNGNGAGRIILDARGMAATHFATYIAGTYTVTARYTGTTGFAASVSPPATLIVEKYHPQAGQRSRDHAPAGTV